MKLTRLFITIIMLHFCSAALAQEITLSRKNITLDRLFEEIKRQIGYDFLYNPHILEKAKPVNVEAVKTPLRTVLDNCFVGQPLTYTIDQRTIIVKEKRVNYIGYSIISGRVTDKNNTPVPNASVFLSNATVGGQTDTAGHFRLENVKPGKYDLVVSIVGFETYHQAINAIGDDIALPDIELAAKIIGLQEVVVKPRNNKFRASDLNDFKQQFLGSTYLASRCRILNPEVLDFDYDDASGTLRASTDDRFLLIDNDALGYKMRYLLEDFTYSRSTIKYNGSVLFEPMHGSASQENRWAKKREEVYASSEMHFMRALQSGKVDDQGFRVLPYLEDPVKHQKVLSRTPVPCTALLHPTDQDGLYAFGARFKALYVEYNPKHRFHENDHQSRLADRTNFESSVISFSSPYLYFDENGWVVNPNDVTILGGWENCRVAGMLPADYEPGQNPPPQPGIIVPDTTNLGKQLMNLKLTSDTLNNKYAPEKIYIQYDKPYYAAGDTIWLKAYLLNAPTFGLSARSGLLHVDIANDSNKVVKQYLFPVVEGLASGKIALDDKDFKPGGYVLRAYTQWMRNFGNNALYYKNITVTGAGNWLVNENISKSKEGIAAHLQFTGIDKAPVANKQLQLQVKGNGKTIYRQNVSTDVNGLLNASFSLPGQVQDATLVVDDKAGGRKAIIPVAADREKDIDLQFMPEGGSLVAGFSTVIGFKAVAGDGKGIDVAGIIVDQSQKQVAIFKSIHNGMGSFDLFPERDEHYTAKINLSDGSVKTYPLPAVKTFGTVLQVKSLLADSLLVSIGATDSVVRAGRGFFVLAKSRGVICYAAVADLRKGRPLQVKLSKSLFPTGITHLILTTAQGRTLNERLVYVDHGDGLNFDIKPDQQAYNPKDSVALHIKVTDKNGDPILGNFSLAVTDDGQVKTDSAGDDNILSRMLLTSDLKGYVEGPGYYFKDQESSRRALDNLLLTQGWVNYDPPAGKLPFEAETEFKVRGRVNNIFNKGLKKQEVVLVSTRPQIVMDTVTDKDGYFVFDHFPRIDTPVFVLKSNKRDFNVNIDVEETPPPVFTAPAWPRIMPWYVNTDTTLISFVKRNTQMQQIQYYPGGGHVLKEVKIRAKKVIKGSYNLNGPGNADIVMDEKDLEEAGKKTWLQLLQERIPGFKIGYFCQGGSPKCAHDQLLLRFVTDSDNPVVGPDWYFVKDKPVKFIIDGVSLYALQPLAAYESAFNNITGYLKSRNAEDLKGIEVNISTKNTYRYIPMKWALDVEMNEVAFVELTTRSGNGPSTKNTPGIYLYKPLAISWPKQFYKPKYTIKDTTNLTDLRSTIDWEPSISTDKNGEATVWFYAAGTPSTYSITIEGVDGNGLLGYKRQKLLITKPKPAVGK